MQYLRLYTGPDQQSHFEDMEVTLASGGGGGSGLSAPVPVMGVVFVRFAAGFNRDLHVAPRRQFVVTLAGAGEIVTGGGETRRLETGTVMLAEDTTGAGHITRSVGGGDWLALWLPLEGESYAQPPGAATPGLSVGGYAHITPTADGGSVIADVALPSAASNAGVEVSELVPARSLIFRRSPPEYDIDWHNAPRRQFVINLTGAVEIVASDGTARKLGAGEILRAEDITGKGHLSRNAGSGERLSLFVPLAD
jgi:uncharacterized cupin superfamily protein